MALNSNALTTLVTAKAWLPIPISETSMDSIVELCINAASERIEREVDRKLASQSFIEYHHGTGQNVILCRQWPVTAVSEVKFDSTGSFSDPSTIVDTSRYTVGDDQTAIVMINGYIVPKGYQNIKLTYTAGYATIPSDLEMACLWLVRYYFSMRQNQMIGKTTSSKGDESSSWTQAMPEEIREILAKYKRTEFNVPHALIWNT